MTMRWKSWLTRSGPTGWCSRSWCVLRRQRDNDRIAQAALYAVKKGMNMEQIEMLVLRMEGLLDPLPDMPGVVKKKENSGGARWVDPNVRAAQLDLESTLGLRVRIRD